MQAVCVAACKKLHEMGAFTDMLLPDKGSKEEGKSDQGDEGDPLPGTARHREFYPEGVANILQVSWFTLPHPCVKLPAWYGLICLSINCYLKRLK